MPKLRSGRHFGLEPSSLADAAFTGTDEQIYAFVIAYRLEVRTPADLAAFMPVIYFEEGQGKPPDAPTYRSGFRVRDVLKGGAGWTSDEIDELGAWLKNDERLAVWLECHFDEIDHAISNSPLWNSALMDI